MDVKTETPAGADPSFRTVLESLAGISRAATILLERQEAERGTLRGALLQVSEALAKLGEGLDGFMTGAFAQHRFDEEMRYRDLLGLLDRAHAIAPPVEVVLRTGHPVATDTVDHRFPHGTARDNTRAPWFVARCERALGPGPLTVLDLGCAGGGLVFDFTLRGHRAVGLEGSDFSEQRLRAEWRLLGDRLFTCDVTRPFELIDTSGGGTAPMRFRLITAWDVMEHFHPDRIDAVLDNVLRHLAPDGLFAGSISTRPARSAPDGTNYHGTIRPREWWVRAFGDRGLRFDDTGPFDHVHFVRGNASCPQHPVDFARSPEAGFHFVARPTEGSVRQGR